MSDDRSILPERPKIIPRQPRELLTMAEAMDSPALFKGEIAEPSWDFWKVYLLAMYGLPMTAEQFEIYRYFTHRETAPTTPFETAALVCGRRSGKTFILALQACYACACKDYSAILRRGELGIVAIVASDRLQAGRIMGYCRGLFEKIDMLRELVAPGGFQPDSITLTNGTQIAVVTNSFRSIRGGTYIAVFMDESAFFYQEGFANPDIEVYAAAEAGVGTIGGSIIVQASSPYAKKGLLYDTFAANFDKGETDTLIWHGTTLELNPSFDERRIAKMMARDPPRARAEFYAIFRDDIAGFILAKTVENATDFGRVEVAPPPGCRPVAFVDMSGGRSDSHVLAIGWAESGAHPLAPPIARIAFIKEVEATLPPVSPEIVVAGFAAELRRYGVRKVIGDGYAGIWPTDMFKRHGIEYELSALNKSQIYLASLAMFNSERVRVVDNLRFRNQICELERRTGSQGGDKVDHPRNANAHDDVSNSVCGCIVAALDGAGRQTALQRARSLFDPPTRERRAG